MRINDKIKEIEKYLDELSDFVPDNFEDYERDVKTKSACERYFEKIIEAVVDLAFLIIKKEKLEIPGDDKEAFDVLTKEKIITKELAEEFQRAKGMRNILAHEYGIVDDEIVFNSIKEELENDVEEFIKQVEENLKKKSI